MASGTWCILVLVHATGRPQPMTASGCPLSLGLPADHVGGNIRPLPLFKRMVVKADGPWGVAPAACLDKVEPVAPQPTVAALGAALEVELALLACIVHGFALGQALGPRLAPGVVPALLPAWAWNAICATAYKIPGPWLTQDISHWSSTMALLKGLAKTMVGLPVLGWQGSTSSCKAKWLPTRKNPMHKASMAATLSETIVDQINTLA